MLPKQRFLQALNHQETDRVPTYTTLTPQVAEELALGLGVDTEPVLARMSQRISHAEVLTKLGNDAVAIRPTWPADVQDRWKRGVLIDDFGFVCRRVGYYTEIVERPLSSAASREDIERFQAPGLDDPEIWKWAKEQIETYGDQFAIIGNLETTIFELCWNLVGLEKFLIDLQQEEEYVFALLDKIQAYSLSCGLKMIELGVDMIWTGDDFGTQTGMLLSPNLWRSVFKPRMAYLFESFKKANPEVKIAYHSDGSITPIIPDLIEIGMEVLNPIQPGARGIDLGALKSEYGEVLAFFGGVDEQEVLPFGDARRVREEVRLRIDQAATNGGFIIAPAHNIQPDTPLENVYAFFGEIDTYRPHS